MTQPGSREVAFEQRATIARNATVNHEQRGRFDLQQDEGRVKGSKQRGRDGGPERSCLQGSARTARGWRAVQRAQDSGDVLKVKGPLSAELSCPGT